MANGFRSGRAPAKSGRRTLFLITLLAILIVLLNIAFGGRISALVRDIVSPVEDAGGKFGAFIASSGYFASRGQLEAQVAALQAEVQQEQLQAAAFNALQQENQSLSSMTHLAQTSPGLAAAITSSVVSSPYGTFMIGAGSSDGIPTGALVLTSDGFAIGKVVQTQAHQSIAEEMFAPGVQTPVSIDGSAVSAVGQGGQALAQIPHGITVSIGDPVIAPQLGGKPIGIVQHIDSNPANAQQTVYIALPISLASIQYVYVTP